MYKPFLALYIEKVTFIVLIHIKGYQDMVWYGLDIFTIWRIQHAKLDSRIIIHSIYIKGVYNCFFMKISGHTARKVRDGLILTRKLYKELYKLVI